MFFTMEEEDFRTEEIPYYIQVLSLLDGVEGEKWELENKIKGISGSEEFAQNVVNFGIKFGAIEDNGLKCTITNLYETVEYGTAKITYNFGCR